MSMFAVVSQVNGDIGFVVNVTKGDIEQAKQLALEGFARWNDCETYPEYEQVGFAEPSMELMDEAGIEYTIDDYYENWDSDDWYYMKNPAVKTEYDGIEEVVL